MLKLKQGFTLIELLVSITIISILIGIGVTSYSNIQRLARDTKRRDDLKQLQTALATYHAQFGSYPSTGGAWTGNCSNPGWTANPWIPNTNNFVPNYVQVLPLDPRDGQDNRNSPACPATGDGSGNPSFGGGADPTSACYLYRSNGTDYKILAHRTAENTLAATDPIRDPNNRDCTYAVYSAGGRNW